MEPVAVSPLEAVTEAQKMVSEVVPVAVFATDSENGVDTPVTESRAQSPSGVAKEGASLADPSAPGTPSLVLRDEEQAAPLRAAVGSLSLGGEEGGSSRKCSKKTAKKKAAKRRAKAAALRAASQSLSPETSNEAAEEEEAGLAEDEVRVARPPAVEVVSLDASLSAESAAMSAGGISGGSPSHISIVVPGDARVSSSEGDAAVAAGEEEEGAAVVPSPEARTPVRSSSSSRYGSSFIYSPPVDPSMPGLEQLPVHLGKLERDKLAAKARRESGEDVSDASPSPLAKFRQRFAPDPELPSLDHLPVYHTRLEIDRDEALKRAEPRKPMRNRAMVEHMRAWSESPKPKDAPSLFASPDATPGDASASSPSQRRAAPDSPAQRTFSSSGVASAIQGYELSSSKGGVPEPEMTLEDLLGGRAAAAARANRGRGERPPRPSHASCIGSLIFGGETAQEVVGVGVAGHTPSPVRPSSSPEDSAKRSGRSQGPAFRRDQRDSHGVSAVLFG